MDPDKLSDQFIPQTHFPLQTFIGMSKEAAEHLHASGGKDWSKVLDEHEAEYGVRGIRTSIHHPYSISIDLNNTYGDPLTKELYSADTQSYRVSGPNRNELGEDGRAVVAVTLHPRNPVRFPSEYGGEPNVRTSTGGRDGAGWKTVEPNMVPPHDAWEQYKDIPTVDEKGKPINTKSDIDDLFSNRIVVTDPASAMTYVGMVPGGVGVTDRARKESNERRIAAEQAAEDARKAKRAEAARNRRAAKKNK